MKRSLAKRPAKGRGRGGAKSAPAPKTGAEGNWDQEIVSGSDEDDDELQDSGLKKKQKGRASNSDDEDDEDDEAETAEQKRRRLAKEYLLSIQGDDDADDGEDDSDGEESEGGGVGRGAADRISSSLRRERLEKQGKYFRTIGSKAAALSTSDLLKSVHSDHDSSVTCVALSVDETTVYSGSKDNSVVMWDLEGNQRRFLRPKWSRATHGSEQSSRGEILSVAVTTDGRYLASGGRDMTVRIYDTRLAESEVRAFQGHRDTVTSLVFRRDSYSLFSGSLDRCLKHWDLNEMGYLETLFGHQDGVTAVDCWTKERPVSASIDRTCRLWKVADETHLVFRGLKSTADSVQIMTEDTFVTGGQDGALHLWAETQKKPLASVVAAHGLDGTNPRWICAIGAVKMSDYAATGSNDGHVRLWNVMQESRKIVAVNAISLEGFVNGLALSPRLVVAGTGREHRLGRWWNCRGNRNKVSVFRLPSSLDSADGAIEQLDESAEEEEEEEDGGDEEEER